MIYVDCASTTPVKRSVLEAMWPYLTEQFGNPSSTHELGFAAAEGLEAARESVARSLGCRAGEIIFTSGGTESDNLAIKGIALSSPKSKHIVTSQIEHEAVLASCDYLQRHHGFRITYLSVDSCCRIDLVQAAEAIDSETTLCSVMLGNNEVGTIQPLDGLVALCREANVPIHTDAVQCAGVLDLSLSSLGVDSMTISGHKTGTPKGTGLLYVKNTLSLEPVTHGGGQERGRRSGTENVALAVGLAVALADATSNIEARSEKLKSLRDLLICEVLGAIPDAFLTGDPVLRLPGHASFCFPGISGEALLLQLQENGIVCSSGSACAAGRDEPSHVLTAMGISADLARTAVRFSLSEDLEVSEVLSIVATLVSAHRRLTGFRSPASK